MKFQIIAIASLCLSSLHAQTPNPDPYAGGKAATPAPAESTTKPNLSICYEAFSLPLAAAAKLQREQLPDSELYTRLLKSVEEETARQEAFVVVRSQSGTRAVTEAITEATYPTEWEPAELPNTVGVAIQPPVATDAPTPIPDPSKLNDASPISAVDGLRTPATPTAFETRNIGTTIELEASLTPDGKAIELLATPEHITSVGRQAWGQEISTCETPEFESQKITTSATVRLNQAYLIGTISRPPVSKADPDSANRVWFAFVTATLPKP